MCISGSNLYSADPCCGARVHVYVNLLCIIHMYILCICIISKQSYTYFGF